MPPFSSSIFGSAEFELAGLGMLPQWQRVVSRMKIESEALARCSVDETRCASPAMRSWRRIGASAAGLDRMAKLRAVNRFFNRWPYKTDRMVYGVGEYWATPTEFMSRSGDCEDYAIAKFFALRELGFRNDEMRIVGLYDRWRSTGHAVLAVYMGQDIFILDNASDAVLSHSRYRHYIPRYLINETTHWRAAPLGRDALAVGLTSPVPAG